MKPFTREVAIRFEHCDPAGIVFYPRYFDMVNTLMEMWLEDGLGASIGHLINERGLIVPTVRTESQFTSPSALEDVLLITLRLGKIGNASFILNFTATCQEEVRFEITTVVVFVDKAKGKSAPIPADIRAKMEPYLG